jgi:cyclopropane-fatty-acyl-phospholipid synthase
LPTLPEALTAVGHSGLVVTDIEILRLHYAETLRRWSARFSARRDEVVAAFGESLYRKWEYYLKGCELSFRLGCLMVFQLQLSKRFETVPVTRDYMVDWERAHRLEADALERGVDTLVATGAYLRESRRGQA